MTGLGLPVAALVLAALIVADFYVPVLPSGAVVASLAGFLAGDAFLVAALIAWAAAASWAGDVLGYQALRRARAGMRRPVLGSAKATRLELGLRDMLRRRPHGTAVVARFLPAGRTALAWAAAAAPGYPHARASAVAAGVWASGTAGVGLLAGRVLGAGPLSAAAAVTTVAALGAVLGWWCRGGVTAGRARRRA